MQTNPTSARQNAPAPTREPLIMMRDIVKVFKTQAGEFTALKGINADFYPGEFVSVVGKSGSGKSTLANMLTGIDHPTSGSVCIGDACVHDLSESEMSIWRGKNLGIVFQFFQLLPMLSLLENVVLPMDFCNIYTPAEREPRALALLERLGLGEVADQLPAAVSGGQQQTAAIARALANDPPILIADEPTGNLDSRTADSIFGIFRELVEQGKTIIMVTHDSGLAKRTDRSLLIADGELIHPSIPLAFPKLAHRRMLWLMHRLQARSFAPGEALPLPTQADCGLYLVQSGQIELLDGAGQVQPPCFQAGDAFSLLDLQGAAGITSARAGGEPLETLALSMADFKSWMQESGQDRYLLQQAAAARRGAL